MPILKSLPRFGGSNILLPSHKPTVLASHFELLKRWNKTYEQGAKDELCISTERITNCSLLLRSPGPIVLCFHFYLPKPQVGSKSCRNLSLDVQRTKSHPKSGIKEENDFFKKSIRFEHYNNHKNPRVCNLVVVGFFTFLLDRGFP